MYIYQVLRFCAQGAGAVFVRARAAKYPIGDRRPQTRTGTPQKSRHMQVMRYTLLNVRDFVTNATYES